MIGFGHGVFCIDQSKLDDKAMSGHNIIVIGASAGGVEAVTQLVRQLPADLSAALFVVLHFPAYSTSVLPSILQREGVLPVRHPQNQEPIQPGHIYVAPPDYHLLVRPDHIQLSRDPKENGHRPAIDPLFRSAAQAHGPHVVGVVLSGMLDDGTVGLSVIKSRGGVAIVQDPNEALFKAMPLSALENVTVDYTLTVSEIASRLQSLAHQPIEEVSTMADERKIEQDASIVAQDMAERERGEQRSGKPSPYTCPDCGGVMWELSSDNLLRYRCHTGHAYSIESLMAEQTDALESALWSAVRALEEKASLSRRLANNAHEQHRLLSEAQFLERAEEAHHHAELIREIIIQSKIKRGNPDLRPD
jgi:two-component system, chemotaxis family, protein-glutamate methylesterase/glutaminase